MHALADLLRRLPAMDFYTTLPFWCVVLLVVILFRQAPERPVLRNLLMLIFSLSMLLMLPRFTIISLVIFTGLCLCAYAAGSLLIHPRLSSASARKTIAAAGITAIVIVLLFFKYRFVQQIFIPRGDQAAVRGADFIFLIGISYSSFKAIHFITDSYKRTIKSAGILEFLNFMFFFPSFISGPINRFNHFVENAALKKKMTGRRDIGPGAERIVHGLFKKVALATLVFPYALTNVSTPLQQMQPWTIVLGLYAYALYFYFDFSGYTDLAIGSARLMGFVLPENFDLPFLKRNIQQLWMHWHMSLTGWLTEYIYWPIVRRLRQGDALRAHPVLISNIAIVITFLVCGLWHGEGANFVLWGLFHGVGIATVNVYQSWKRKIRHERALRYFRSPVSYCVGVAATFSFFAVGLTMFVLDMQQIGVLARRLLTVL